MQAGIERAQPNRGARRSASDGRNTAHRSAVPPLDGNETGAKCAVRLYTEEHAQWLRVILWANDIAVPPLAMILAKRAKRSAENCSPGPPGEGLGSGAEPQLRV